jgi:nucleoside-diphosphate-sugar epimerase
VDVRPGQADYHGTKAAAEQLVREWPGELERVAVRPTITYGPGDRDGMLTRLIGLVASGRFVRVGRGDNHLHLTYINDLVRGLVLAGTHPDAPGETFILAGPRSIAVRDMLALIEQTLGLKPHSLYLPESLARPAAWTVEFLYRAAGALRLPLPRSGPPVTPAKLNVLCAHRSFSSAKAMRLLSYAAHVDYPEGLVRTLTWMGEAGLLPMPHSTASTAHPGSFPSPTGGRDKVPYTRSGGRLPHWLDSTVD